MIAVAFVLAAAAGTLVRAEAGRRWNRHDGFPAGTLAVNVAGSFVLGLLHELGPPAITIVGVGGLGALTTFSSFVRDVAALVSVGRLALAAGYVAVSCAGGFAAAAVGIAIA